MIEGYILIGIGRGDSRGISDLDLLDLFDSRRNSYISGTRYSITSSDLLPIQAETVESLYQVYIQTLKDLKLDDIKSMAGAQGIQSLTPEIFECHKNFMIERADCHINNRRISFSPSTHAIKFEKKNDEAEVDSYLNAIVEYFGEKRVYIDKRLFNVIIHFPEKEVRNSNGAYHKIYDVYVKLQYRYSSDNRSSDNLGRYIIGTPNQNLNFKLYVDSGTRTTFSEEEYLSNYMFSHFSRGRDGFQSCCLGSGTTLSKLEGNELKSIEHVYGFCSALDRYLEWESLEGGPYIKISEVRSANFRRRNVPDYAIEYEDFFKAIFSNVIASDTSMFIHIDSNLEFDLNTATLNSCTPLFKTRSGEYLTLEHLEKYSSSNNESFEKNNKLSYTKPRTSFVFKDQNISKNTIDPTLNKNQSLEFLSESFYPDSSSYYGIMYREIKTILQSIIQEKNEEYTERKPAYEIG